MPGRKRRAAQIAGAREARAIAATLGRETRITRRRRQLTQAALGERVNLSQSEISHLERGHGARASIDTWVAIGMALNRPIAIGFSRDVVDPMPADAGHLAAQELLLRVASAAGWETRFEAPSNPAVPRHAIDIVLLNRQRTTILVEIWNRLDDLGAAVRSTDRKIADIRSGAPTRSVWAMVDTTANREIVRRYPAILRARFGGSSARWIQAITAGTTPPSAPGLVWVGRVGLRELRLPASTAG